MKRLISQILILLLFLPQVALPSDPLGACEILVSEEKFGGRGDNFLLSRTSYRVTGVSEGSKVNATGFLGDDQMAVAFNLDGSVKLFYGKMEAILEKNTPMSFQVIPVDHDLDLREHDVILVYRKINKPLRTAVENLFSFATNDRVQVPGYNCVDAFCKVLRGETGEYVDANVFLPEKFMEELVGMSSWKSGYKVSAYVSTRAKSLEDFYDEMRRSRSDDPLSRAEAKTKRLLLKGTIAGGIGTPFGVLAYLYYVLLFT